jgi:hypothetical protein
MTWETIVFSLVALVLLAILVRLLWEPEAKPTVAAPEAADKIATPEHRQIEELFPLHCRYFPQMRQTLLGADEEFMRKRASATVRRRWRKERRRLALEFLAGLRDDFRRLNALAREVARLSPRLSERQEAELFWLGVRFQLLYALVRARIGLGWAALGGLTEIAGMVSSLAASIEAAMESLEAGSRARLRSPGAGLTA